jgi:hypothetical protein
MPSALLTNCPEPGCSELVASGRCAAHANKYEQQRGSSSARGYDYYWRTFFHQEIRDRMVALDIAPVCGAALPGGPSMVDSQCKTAGVFNDRDLHLDHDPPLQAHERRNRRAVCDPTRVGWLCASCHARKTKEEQRT